MSCDYLSDALQIRSKVLEIRSVRVFTAQLFGQKFLSYFWKYLRFPNDARRYLFIVKYIWSEDMTRQKIFYAGFNRSFFDLL
ncbi:hypothetical protein ACT18_17685 [Mycolicibacter kumamotonensis]|uniref:Uncharacterized protein n=1 Tax=Mycolicibacter kumamotonensis TaxID=354243 RepID=A0A1B8SCN5_9MYCO|nr:hypothetical protein ACT18_17685 [Mycolicibacter kumamotonensis]